MERPQIKVGVATVVRKDGKVLSYQRHSDNGDGTWGMPGGHLEYGESFEECARREALEEAGIELGHMQFVAATSDLIGENHYVTIFMVADYLSGSVEWKEPDQGGVWQWFTWEELPQPLFAPIVSLINQGYHPFHSYTF